MKKYMIIIPMLLVLYVLTLDFSNDKKSDSLSFNDKEEEIQENDDNQIDLNSKSVLVSYNGEEVNMAIDDYIVGVVACEVPALFDDEALKAMAVVARTFYLYKDKFNENYVANNMDQCFNDEVAMREKWGDNYDKYLGIIKDAVSDTVGEFITYDGEVIESFYFSLSNGKTEECENVFSESKPYLISVDSEWDKNVNNYENTLSMDKSEFLHKLGLEISSDIDINVVSKSNSGRVNSILVNGLQFKGTEFRKRLGIRSTDFDVIINENNIDIVTRGYGHGVGMSQYGANEMAKLGYTYKDIIKHYYTGVEISSL